MKRQTRWINVLLIVALLMAWPGSTVMAQTPVGAAFTYQGRLLDSSNVPVNGLCDMSFMLYDEESGGAQIGATQTITDVVMSDGYFSAALDFGAPAWNGDTRWLNVEATCPPGGSLTGFPRQVVSAVPYAVYALSGNAITSTVYYTPSYHLQGWETITGTPGTYTPTAHTQDWTTITGQPSEYTPTAHMQDWTTITDAPGTYTPTAHTQAWSTITSQPSTYTPTAHTQDWSTITGSQLTLTNPTGPSTMTASVAATTGQVTLNSTGTNPGFIFTPPVTFTNNIIFSNAVGAYGAGRVQAKSTGDLIGLTLNSTTRVWDLISIASATPDYFAIRDNTAGLNRLVIDANGRISNGEPAPAYALQISDGANASPYIQAYFSSTMVDGYGGIGVNGKNQGHVRFFINDVLKWQISAGAGVGADALGIHSFTKGGDFVAFFNNNGNVGIGTTTDNGGKLQVAGNVLPSTTNTYDLGSSSYYWATIHYHTLTSHSLSVFSTTVTLQNGKEVSCLDALKEIKADPTKNVKGMPHMDYATIPVAVLNAAPTSFAPTAYGGYPIGKNGEDGADLDMMVSLVLCAEKELDAKSAALDNRMSDLEKRIADLERKVQ